MFLTSRCPHGSASLYVGSAQCNLRSFFLRVLQLSCQSTHLPVAVSRFSFTSLLQGVPPLRRPTMVAVPPLEHECIKDLSSFSHKAKAQGVFDAIGMVRANAQLQPLSS